MALSAAIVWEVRTDGHDGNGGAFKAGATGTDRSQQAAAQATLTTASTVHTTTTQVTVAVGDFTVSSADVGNVLQITGGTATAGFYEITAADVPNNRWTLDRSAGTAGQTVVGKMGGALASPGLATARYVAGNTIWIKSGAYTLTTTTPGAGGPMHSTTANAGVRIRGYEATRGDDGAKPLLDVAALTAFSVVYCSWNIGLSANQQFIVERIAVDGQGGASVIGFNVQITSGYGFQRVVECEAIDCATGFLIESAIGCRATGCTVGFDLGGYLGAGPPRLISDCVAYAGTTGFRMGYHGFATNCLAAGCSGDGFDAGTNTSSFAVNLTDCTAIACGSDGFYVAGGTTYCLANVVNCLATHCLGYGFNIGLAGTLVSRCAGYRNSLGNCTQSDVFVRGFVTLIADPFRQSASGLDPRPMQTQDALRVVPFPSTVPVTRYIGAVPPEFTPAPRTRPLKGRR